MSSTTLITALAIGRRNRLAAAGAVMVAVFVTFAIFAPWIAPHDPRVIDLPSRLRPPSAAHWFGTDELGRDILSRVIYAGRISMVAGSSVAGGAVLLAVLIGLAARDCPRVAR